MVSSCFCLPLCRLMLWGDLHTPPAALSPLSLHDALPICLAPSRGSYSDFQPDTILPLVSVVSRPRDQRSEEHTSELQSRGHLVCRLLLETKNKYPYQFICPSSTGQIYYECGGPVSSTCPS